MLFHFWFIKHLPRDYCWVHGAKYEVGPRPEYSWRFRHFSNWIGDAILAEAISRSRIDLEIPKSDKIHLCMSRSSLVLDLWPNIGHSVMKNCAWKQVVKFYHFKGATSHTYLLKVKIILVPTLWIQIIYISRVKLLTSLSKLLALP